LAQRLGARAELAVTLSLAGRTTTPAAQPVPVRRGGFGGITGLSRYLVIERIDALIDATHPYAAMISANAIQAAAASGVPLVALKRAPWTPVAGDRWTDVGDVREAIERLGIVPRRVFVALGRKDVAPFVDAPRHHYVIRSVDPIVPPLALPSACYITGRGPFSEVDDRTLLREHRIEILIAKNSGGPATYGKIAAARMLSLPVIMLRRPAPSLAPTTQSVETVDDAVAWVDQTLAH